MQSRKESPFRTYRGHRTELQPPTLRFVIAISGVLFLNASVSWAFEDGEILSMTVVGSPSRCSQNLRPYNDTLWFSYVPWATGNSRFDLYPWQIHIQFENTGNETTDFLISTSVSNGEFRIEGSATAGGDPFRLINNVAPGGVEIVTLFLVNYPDSSGYARTVTWTLSECNFQCSEVDRRTTTLTMDASPPSVIIEINRDCEKDGVRIEAGHGYDITWAAIDGGSGVTSVNIHREIGDDADRWSPILWSYEGWEDGQEDDGPFWEGVVGYRIIAYDRVGNRSDTVEIGPNIVACEDYPQWCDKGLVIIISSDVNCEDLDDHDFGSQTVDDCTGTHTWTVMNEGDATLNGSVSLTGSHSSQFEITQGDGSFSLGAEQSRTVKVRFCPTGPGDKSATLRITSNDRGENPCDISLSGTSSSCTLAARASSPSPSDGASDVSTSSDLDWASVSGATYKVYFGTDSSPDGGEFKDNTESSSWSLGTLAVDTTYYWRIDTVNSCGKTTGTVWDFMTGSPCTLPARASSPSPSDGASDVSTSSDLDWASVSGATYKVYFGTDSSPDGGEFKDNTESNSWSLGTLAVDTTYYWRIDSVNSCGTTTGTVWDFTTGSSCTLPARASSPSPSDGASDVSMSSDLDWASLSGATYRVYFGTDSSPDGGEFKGNTESSSWLLGTLAVDTKYYWRIDTVNSCGTTTGTVWDFTTGSSCAFPARASSPSPSDGASPVRRSSDLDWASVSGATYKVYFGTDSSPDSGEFKGNTGSSSWSLGMLAVWTTYYWRIDTVNSCGTTTGTVWDFTTGSSCAFPARASGPSPSDGASDVSMGADLTWEYPPDVGAYVFFGTDPTPDDGEFYITSHDGLAGLGVLEENTTYYWRIDTVNSCDITTGTVWVFRTGSSCVLPARASSPSPSDGASDVSTSSDLDWASGVSPDVCRVYFGTDSSPDGGEFKDNTRSSSWSPGTLAGGTTYYWRIDRFNSCGTTTGTVWAFTTEGVCPPPPEASAVEICTDGVDNDCDELIDCDDDDCEGTDECTIGPAEAYHPADQPQGWNEDCACATCNDGRIEMCEAIAYAAAWKRGDHNDMAAGMRGLYLWRNGECYQWDDAQQNWVPTPCQ